MCILVVYLLHVIHGTCTVNSVRLSAYYDEISCIPRLCVETRYHRVHYGVCEVFVVCLLLRMLRSKVLVSLPSLLPDELPMDRMDSNGVNSKSVYS